MRATAGDVIQQCREILADNEIPPEKRREELQTVQQQVGEFVAMLDRDIASGEEHHYSVHG